MTYIVSSGALNSTPTSRTARWDKPWCHPSPNLKRHLDQFSRCGTAHGCELVTRDYNPGRFFDVEIRQLSVSGDFGIASLAWHYLIGSKKVIKNNYWL